MKVYLDLILILNFFLDFALLITLGLLLKRQIKIKNITLSAFIGSLSVLLLFFNITSFGLFFIKLAISLLMLLIAYPRWELKYFLYNLLFFYLISIFLGGFLYLLKVQLGYHHIGLVFISDGLSINFILMFFLTPLILFFYTKEHRLMKSKYNNYYDVCININNQIITGIGYIDSGNNLSFKGHPIILLDKRKDIFKDEAYRIIPFKVASGVSLLKIYRCDEVIINNKRIKNIYLGLMNEEINIDGVDILLNNRLMEEI